MIIVCDIDNILNDLISQTLTLYNTNKGKNIKSSDITTYELVDCLSLEDAEGICALFKEKSLWHSLKPLPDSQKALHSFIKSGHDVYLATSTDPINFEWKIQWVKKYYPLVNTDNVIRIMNKGLLNCDVMIDDCLSNLKSNICERIVLDYPWNRSESTDYAYNIHRAYNWSDIVNIINNLEKEMKEWDK